MKLLDIAEVASLTGTAASTLRFYEEKGLIASIGRKGARRIFEPSILQRLALISLGRTAGFSLEEIGRMFASSGAMDLDRDLLRAKADELDEKIGRLQAMRDGLRHAAECPAPRHSECPTFQRLLQRAMSGRLAPERQTPAARLRSL
ncbi:helix-turn-helix domain-containing protein [Phenylobacterium sp.]|jgi:DNA-binding transcriptional MerR regulator|uniref:helix-turn-helix domain-containing protein n=1 Tax=Phenylobacterium sp. TaxID=1871053 RepID=UPI002F9554A3